MAFKLGDVIIDRLQFGYGANKKTGNPLYALTPVSYTHLDVYKRQRQFRQRRIW